MAGARSSERVLLTLVVPTRNEASNVPRLVRDIEEALDGISYRVVFVDDSTDETPEVVRSLGESNGRLTLIHREAAEQGGGLSTAVTAGIDVAAETSEYLCVMDADLQHPPERVGEMLRTARSSGADVVVASRYTEGGSYEGLSGPARRAVSSGSKYLAQVVFKEARKTTDPMTGFFLLRSEAISGLQFRPTGFKILVEILVCAPDLKVEEVPFAFQSRGAGVSKASLRQGLEYLAHLASLFWYVPSAGRFWKFAMVGASGVLVNMVTLITLAEYVGADLIIAWMFAVGVSILSNFLLNNAFTWRDVRNSTRIHFLMRGALAYPAAIIGIGANFSVYYPLLTYVSDAFPYYVAFNFLGILAATVVNFALNSRFVFRSSTPKKPGEGAHPEEVAGEIRREVKADWVGLMRASDLDLVASMPRRSPTEADRDIAGLALGTAQPTLVATGPRRPQARTNTRWANSLAVPLLHGSSPVGVVYATRNSREQFTDEDLQWLTSYVSSLGPVFEAFACHNGPLEAPNKLEG
ncbi:MAG: glycosyltransferase [Rubrobacter sp.]|nr:glycosyltransferase [Rubrobacter sp.]